MAKFAVFILACFLLPAAALAQDGFAAWRQGFLQQAARDGISEETLQRMIPYLVYDPKVIELDQKQPEKIETLKDYLAQIVTEERIERGRQELQDHADLLNQIEKKYDVPAEVIVALWAIESNFGERQGNFNTFSALATLAYDGRRKEFFEGELLAAVHLAENMNIPLDTFMGSWAGAMGQCQFMPSSLLKYGQDADGDGKIDIWNSPADVFASMANYLSQNGWDLDSGIAQAVTLPQEFNPENITEKLEKPVSEWHAMGVVRPSGAELYLSGAPAMVLQPDGPGSQAYLVYGNYKVLMRWNRSAYFALAVSQLADKINPKLKAPRS